MNLTTKYFGLIQSVIISVLFTLAVGMNEVEL